MFFVSIHSKQGTQPAFRQLAITTSSTDAANKPSANVALSQQPKPRTTGLSSLSDQGAGGGGLVSPGGGKDTDGLVVAGQTVDTGLDENQAELGVLVLAVALKVLADGDSLVSLVDLWVGGQGKGKLTFLIKK